MDPNAALARIWENARSLNTDRTGNTDSSAADQAEIGMELAEDVVNLHEWLSGGGFLPNAWNRPTKNRDRDEVVSDLIASFVDCGGAVSLQQQLEAAYDAGLRKGRA